MLTVLAEIKTESNGAYLIVNRICDIPQVEEKDEHHRIRQLSSASNVLFASHTDVDEGPEYQARSEFIEGLEVERADCWVQFTTDVKLSQG